MATARKLNYLASAHTCNHTSTDRDLENQRVVIQYKYKQMKLSLGVIQTVQHTVQVIETGNYTDGFSAGELKCQHNKHVKRYNNATIRNEHGSKQTGRTPLLHAFFFSTTSLLAAVSTEPGQVQGDLVLRRRQELPGGHLDDVDVVRRNADVARAGTCRVGAAAVGGAAMGGVRRLLPHDAVVDEGVREQLVGGGVGSLLVLVVIVLHHLRHRRRHSPHRSHKPHRRRRRAAVVGVEVQVQERRHDVGAHGPLQLGRRGRRRRRAQVQPHGGHLVKAAGRRGGGRWAADHLAVRVRPEVVGRRGGVLGRRRGLVGAGAVGEVRVQAADVLLQDGPLPGRHLLRVALLLQPALGLEAPLGGVPVVLHGVLGTPGQERGDGRPVVAAPLVRLDQRHVVFFSPHALLLIIFVALHVREEKQASKQTVRSSSSKDPNKAH
jgi:hypothetical protein